MNSATYTNKAQLRGYQTLKALFGHEVTGVSCLELANRLGASKGQVHKDLTVLEQAGLAEQLPSKNWRLASALGLESFKIQNAVDSARRRVDEAAARYGINV